MSAEAIVLPCGVVIPRSELDNEWELLVGCNVFSLREVFVDGTRWRALVGVRDRDCTPFARAKMGNREECIAWLDAQVVTLRAGLLPPGSAVVRVDEVERFKAELDEARLRARLSAPAEPSAPAPEYERTTDPATQEVLYRRPGATPASAVAAQTEAEREARAPHVCQDFRASGGKADCRLEPCEETMAHPRRPSRPVAVRRAEAITCDVCDVAEPPDASEEQGQPFTVTDRPCPACAPSVEPGRG